MIVNDIQEKFHEVLPSVIGGLTVKDSKVLLSTLIGKLRYALDVNTDGTYVSEKNLLITIKTLLEEVLM